VKNEGKQREKLEKQRERQEEKASASWRLSRGIEIDDVLLALLYTILYSFYGFHFLLQRRELHVPPARQAKTSLFSGLECKRSPPTSILCHAMPYHTIPYHTIPYPFLFPFQIGVARRQSVLLSEIEIPAPGRLVFRLGVCVCVCVALVCWLHLIPQSEIRKNFN